MTFYICSWINIYFGINLLCFYHGSWNELYFLYSFIWGLIDTENSSVARSVGREHADRFQPWIGATRWATIKTQDTAPLRFVRTSERVSQLRPFGKNVSFSKFSCSSMLRESVHPSKLVMLEVVSSRLRHIYRYWRFVFDYEFSYYRSWEGQFVLFVVDFIVDWL